MPEAAYGEHISIDGLRLFRWVLLGTIAFAAACSAAVIGGLVAQRHAIARCTETPPDLPRALKRASEVSVDWTLIPPRYACVYQTRRGIVRRPPP
jgi:hypothetical protein